MTYTPSFTYDLLNPDAPSQAELDATRMLLLKDLRAAGIQTIEVQYSADEDTAHIQSLSLRPAAASTTKDLSDRVVVFCLDFTYSVNLGCKHSLGNHGTLIWDLSIDRIDSFHSETYINVESVTHRGL